MKDKEYKSIHLDNFKNEKVGGRKEVRQSVVKVLKGLNPVALHQFGSGGKESSDEFSDLDFFVTLKDEDFEQKAKLREETYLEVGPILIRLYGKIPNPMGWYHDLIIYDTNKGLFHVDYYLTSRSKAVLPPDAILIEGVDDLPEGEWAVEGEPGTEGHDLYEGILAMSFIGVKGVVRKWGSEFFDYLRSLYNSYRENKDHSFGELPKENNFDLIKTILSNLYIEGNQRQQKANRKIQDYVFIVKQLYGK